MWRVDIWVLGYGFFCESVLGLESVVWRLGLRVRAQYPSTKSSTPNDI